MFFHLSAGKKPLFWVFSINKRQHIPYKLGVDILTFSPDVNSKKSDIGYEILWDLHHDLNNDLASTIICSILRDERTEEKYHQLYFISGSMVLVKYYFLKHSNLNHVRLITAIISLMVLLESPRYHFLI